MQQLRRAADELGRTVVMVMHDLNFAAAYSDQLLAMADGQIVAHGPVRELMDGRLLTGVFGTPVQVMDVAGSPTALYCLGKACPACPARWIGTVLHAETVPCGEHGHATCSFNLRRAKLMKVVSSLD